MSRTAGWLLIALVVATFLPASVIGQSEPSPEPVADASDAFRQIVDAYRKRPALKITAALTIELAENDVSASSRQITAEIVYAGRNAGIVRIGGFTCHFNDGAFFAVHEASDDAYYRSEYEDAPFWILWDSFRDMPYPHIGILWGEEDPEEVWMELELDTPELVPTELGERLVDGRAMRRLRFASDAATLEMIFDPETKLIRSIVHEVTGGDVVQPGTRKITTYAYEYVTHDKPLPPAEIAFRPGDRERVEVIASLLPQEPAGVEAAPPIAAQIEDLVGTPAPSFILATADGGAIDLEELRGKVVVLDFWATWCKPCVAAGPLLHAVARWAREEELPVAVLTINVWEAAGRAEDTPDGRLRSVQQFIKEKGFTLPVAMDYTDETAAAYGVTAIPATFVIRSDGIVHARLHPDVSQLKTAIRDALHALEAPPGGDDG